MYGMRHKSPSKLGVVLQNKETLVMDMIRVNSSAISAIGYSAADLHLKIKFVQGHTYDFCRVPQSVFDGLLSAKSKGAYYNDHIKDRYKC